LAVCSAVQEHADEAYAVIHNIPKSFHSKDLRRYFDEFVENERFLCFHFQHRPEQRDGAHDSSVAPQLVDAVAALKTLCCPVRLTAPDRALFIRKYHGKFWTNELGTSLRHIHGAVQANAYLCAA